MPTNASSKAILLHTSLVRGAYLQRSFCFQLSDFELRSLYLESKGAVHFLFILDDQSSLLQK